MRDTTIIKLSADALDRLFPEGTDARLQLQHAVLAEAANRYVKGALTDDIRKYLRDIVATASAELNADKLIAEAFKPFAHWSQTLEVKPDSNIGKTIAESVKEAHRIGASNLARDMAREAVEAIVDTAHLRGEIARHISDQLGSQVRKDIAKRVEAALLHAQKQTDN